VDGAVNAVGWVTSRTGRMLTKLQTGHVQEYVTGAAFLGAVIGLALLIAAMFLR
jgi:hypothetical protein